MGPKTSLPRDVLDFAGVHQAGRGLLAFENEAAAGFLCLPVTRGAVDSI
jgi:hypothetical protein